MNGFTVPDGTPSSEGVVTRGGVDLRWTVHGDGPVTVVLLPTWSIVPSRFWRAQVPFLARTHRVVTFDGRGSGASSRPRGAAAYRDAEYAADTVAVLDALAVERTVLVGLSAGATWALRVAATHRERVAGVVALSPACAFDLPPTERDAYPWGERHTTTEGWASYNRHVWLEGGRDRFVDFFFHRMYSEPHSTKQIEDGIAWAHEISAETLVDTVAGRLAGSNSSEPNEPTMEEWCAQVTCPVLVLHGTHDEVRPIQIGERLAELTGGELVRLEGSGHGAMGRDPVTVNLAVRSFVDRVLPRSPAAATGGRTSRRRPRALYLSSPIGLGHARRDVAIAGQLRALRPELEIDWLAQDPVTRVLADAGERVHPASSALVSESRHIEGECGEHDLHAFQAIRRMDAILATNFMVYADLMREEDYDLVIADEAWDVDHFLHENPDLKRTPFAWMTDFVGWLPMPDGGAAEAALTADLNAEMLEHREKFRWVRDQSIFVGNERDVVDARFGPGLPAIRDWTSAHFDYAGYVSGGATAVPEERAAMRLALGWRTDEQVCVVTVGGSGVGEPLLRRVLDAVPLARRGRPELRFHVVTGPRIDPRSLPEVAGVTVRGYDPHLRRALDACDVAVVQGGLSTCMELTESRRPFVYVPLRHHFEQNLHVRHRLENYRAGRCLDYEQVCDPDLLAETLLSELDRVVDYEPVETDGAERAARLLAALV